MVGIQATAIKASRGRSRIDPSGKSIGRIRPAAKSEFEICIRGQSGPEFEGDTFAASRALSDHTESI